jgi:hypothetical protein
MRSGAEVLLPKLPNYRFVALSPDLQTEVGPAVVEGAKPLDMRGEDAAATRKASVERWGSRWVNEKAPSRRVAPDSSTCGGAAGLTEATLGLS